MGINLKQNTSDSGAEMICKMFSIHIIREILKSDYSDSLFSKITQSENTLF